MLKNQTIHSRAGFQLYDLLPLGVCVIDSTLTVHGWNQRLVDWTGLSRETAIGMNLGEEYLNLLSDRFHNRLQCLFATENPIVFTAAFHKFFIPICLSASDEMMFQHTQVRPILDGSGRALVIIQDVTSQCHHLNELRKERTRLRQSETELAERAEELARSNSDLEQFAYVASHDLKEPLRMVKSFTLLLAEEYTGKLDDEADTYIKYASDGATRMQTLIDDLLSYSRTGTANESLDAVNLQEIVTQVVSDQEPTIQ